MESATITTRTLDIDGMSGDTCVQKVTGALKNVQGVTTQSVKVGAATIGSDQAGCTAACTALGTAGFKSRERASTPASLSGSTPAEHTPGNQSVAQNATPKVEAAVASDSSAKPAERATVAVAAKPATTAV